MAERRKYSRRNNRPETVVVFKSECEEQLISFLAAQDTVDTWNKLKEQQQVDDSALAAFLLKCYEDTKQQPVCSACNMPLTHFCPRCILLVPGSAPKEKQASPHDGRIDDDNGQEGDLKDSNLCLQTGIVDKRNAEKDNNVSVCVETGIVPLEMADQNDNGQEDDLKDSSLCLQTGIVDKNSAEKDNVSVETGITQFDMADQKEDDNKLYVVSCALCDVSFISVKDLTMHLVCHASWQWQQLHQTAVCMADGPEKRKTSVWLNELKEKEGSVDHLDADMKQDSASLSENYSCLYCGACYKKSLTFTKHLQKHFQKYAFRCYSCKSSFDSLKELETHLDLHTHSVVQTDNDTTKLNYRPYHCRICGIRFRYLGFLANHIEKHTEPNPLWCPHCEQGFQLISELTGHKCRGKQDVSEIKEPCQETSSSDTSLLQEASNSENDFAQCASPTPTENVQEHHAMDAANSVEDSKSTVENVTQPLPNKLTAAEFGSEELVAKQQDGQKHEGIPKSAKKNLYKCPDCPSTFQYQSMLKIHSQKHTGQNAFPCPHCERSFQSKRKLLDHQQRDHWGSAPITCFECGKVVKSMLMLDQHLRSHTGELPFPCHICGKKFKNHTALSIHRRTHKSDCFRCRVCGASFQEYNAYKVHLDSHSGIKAHLCPVCGTAFATRPGLKRHMLKHGQKQFVCEHCGRAFYTRGECNTHAIQHLAIKPYACEHCDMRFIKRDKLTRHHRSVHLKVKPFKCKQCEAAYSDPYRLNEHERAKHTGERPFRCSICGKSFAKSGCRQAHLRIHKLEVKKME